MLAEYTEFIANRAGSLQYTMPAAAAANGGLEAPRLGEPLPYCEQSGCIYLDWNATSPIFPEVWGALAMSLLGTGLACRC